MPKPILLVLALLLAGPASYAAQDVLAAAEQEEVLSFDMWCLDMRLYPQARCDARNTQDVSAYQQYRATLERFLQERAARQARDRQIQDRLNRDTTAPQPSGPTR